ncbi:Ig-like domain-containing protein, partial [Mesorhizobium sp. LNJC384A00]|uniref:Ig-like domain-containing protein n=1 Tax=Mesorhizobium sp. LNJC384A00 TaxID=1287268 RepID=UPI0004CDF364
TDNNSNVTFTFSEKVSDATFAGLASGAGITVAGGTLSALTWNAGHTAATATFTATDASETAGSVTVDAGYTDVAGNLGTSGTDTVTIDTLNPSVIVNIVDGALSDTDNNSNVTFTFSEKVSDATFAGLA